MKKCRYIWAAALIICSIITSANAANIDIPQNAIQEAVSTYCEMQKNGTLYQHIATAMDIDDRQFSLTPLFPGTSKYCLSCSTFSSRACGIVDVETGKIVLPIEYTKIGCLTNDRVLVVKTTDTVSECWFAAPDGSLMPAQLPLEGEVLGIDSGRVTIGVYQTGSYLDIYAGISDDIKIPRLTLLDENLAIIRDNLDGAYPAKAVHFINGAAPIRIGSKKWEGSVKYQDVYGDGKCGLIDCDGNSVGAQDFDKIDEADGHWIGKRIINSNGKLQEYLLDGKGGEMLIPNDYFYSRWAENEIDNAMKHELFLWFDYPQLNITRLNFAKLVMKLYNKMQPDTELPSGAPYFSDECQTDVLSASALGIINGYADGTFRPYQSITRQEAAVMLDRLYRLLGGTVDIISKKLYADDAQFGDWARNSVYSMREIDIMHGKDGNRFYPQDGYTGEQAIVTIERMYAQLQG